MSDEQQKSAVAYLDSMWTRIETWREGVDVSQVVSVDDAVYTFESLINLYEADMTPLTIERKMIADNVILPSATSLDAAQAAEAYDEIVAFVNSALVSDGNSQPRLVGLDLEIDSQDATKLRTLVIVENDAAPQIPSATNSFFEWANELVVPEPARVDPSCFSPLKADLFIETRLNQQLARTVPPLNPVFGGVRFNPGDAFGGPFPLVVDLSTFDYPSGSDDLEEQGEFLAHSDKGREEVCFTQNKTFKYIETGEEIAKDVVRPLVPRGTVIGRNGKRMRMAKQPYLASIRAQAGGVEVRIENGEEVYFSSRNHGNFFAYGNFPFTITLPDRDDILQPQ